MWYLYIIKYYTVIQKNEIIFLCSNMDASGGHYPKLINTGTENQIPHVLTYKWELNSANT